MLLLARASPLEALATWYTYIVSSDTFANGVQEIVVEEVQAAAALSLSIHVIAQMSEMLKSIRIEESGRDWVGLELQNVTELLGAGAKSYRPSFIRRPIHCMVI